MTNKTSTKKSDQVVGDVMTPNPITLSAMSTVLDAAKEMRQSDVGAVIVQGSGGPCGIVTDRDIVVRCVAEGHEPRATQLGEICSFALAVLSPRDSVDNAVSLMRKKAIRRVPVLDEERRVVGILSLGDLAIKRDPESALGGISAAAANT